MVYYEPIPASDGTSLTAPSNAEFRVFEVADTARANPLELRTVAGTNAAPLVTTAQGVLPGVEVVSPNFSHIFKSGEWEWRRDSVEGIRKAAEEARQASTASASEAQGAKASAEAAASVAGEAAVSIVQQKLAAGEFKGEPGQTGLPGVNAIPAQTAVAQYLQPGVSTDTIGVGATPSPAYQARILVPNETPRTGLRIDQLNTSTSNDAVKIVNKSKSYALKIDQTSDDNDVVNISGQGAGAYTVLGLGGTNTTLSTMKVTNSALQVGGAVIFAQGTHPERTSSVFTAENWGKGASYSARAMNGNNNTAFRALYDAGFNHDARAVWIDANHSGGSIMYVNNATAQTSGRMVHLIQANASSTAPIIAIENSGTGDHVTANNFAVTQTGQVKANALLNFGSFNNARIQLAAAGTSIDRNVSDTNATLRVNNINASSKGDVVQFQKASEIKARITAAGHFAVRANTAPLDGDLVAGEAAFWFDSTNGTSKLMVKAKQADGTIKSGSVNLA